MTNTEQRVAKAINATAQQISADSIPPFRVAQAPSQFGGRLLSPLAGRRWPLLFAPVAVAAAVAVIAVAAVAIGNRVAGHRSSVSGSSESVPPYYVALNYKLPITANERIDVVIRSTATGKVLATVPPPAQFTPRLVAAAADDRTFVMASVEKGVSNPAGAQVRFELVRFNPALGAVAVDSLPISGVTVNGSDGALWMALSPDGRSLAVSTTTFLGIRVYSVPGGAHRAWKGPSAELFGLAWAGPRNPGQRSRMLAYFYFPVGVTTAGAGLHVLDSGSHSSGLLSASHVPPIPRRDDCEPAWFLPAPSMIVCVSPYRDHGVDKAAIEEFSLGTGKLLRRLPLPGVVQGNEQPQVAWANRSGTKVIVLMAQAGSKPYQSASAYLMAGGRITKLPGARWSGLLGEALPVSW